MLSKLCISTIFRHPDKNNSPEANNKFLQITEAYEVLSDKRRRQSYDHQPDSIFTMFNKNFFFAGHPDDTINLQQYNDHIIPQSFNIPYLLYLYHDFCLPCVHVSNIWDQLKMVQIYMTSCDL